MMTDPSPSQPPQVLFWFKFYAGFMCFLYLAVAAVSLIFFLVAPDDLEMPPTEAHIIGAMLLVVGLGLFGAFLLPLVLAPRPWLWTYNLIVICLGMTSACFWPVCIPLLIYWLKPDVKRYFGMG